MNTKEIQVKDKIVVNNNKYSVSERYMSGGLKKGTIIPGRGWVSIDDLIEADEIQGHEKYAPIISYDGSMSYVNSYALDEVGRLVYLDIVGQEQHVRSITSVIMQGKTQQKDKWLHSDAFAVNVFDAGNRRFIQSLSDGIAHAKIVNNGAVIQHGFNILLGDNEDEIFASFERWLDLSMKMPCIKEDRKELFEELKERYIFKTSSYNIEAYSVSSKLLEDDCKIFRDIVLNIGLKKGHIKSIAKEVVYQLPKSEYLTEEQVKVIMKDLERLPDAYELDGVDIKPVGLKLFGPVFKYYIVESNKGDEYYEPFERCFAYIENTSAPDCSEWGYVSVPEILETTLQVPISINGKMGSIPQGFEKDLYFEDMYIDSNGKLIKKEEIAS